MINSFLLEKPVTHTPEKHYNNEFKKNECMLTHNYNEQIRVLIKEIWPITKCFLHSTACEYDDCAVNNNGNVRNKFNHTEILTDTYRYLWELPLFELEFTHYRPHCDHVASEAEQGCRRERHAE